MTLRFTRMILPVTVIITLLAAGCSKNSDRPADPVPVPTDGRLAKVEYKDGVYDSVFYNSDGDIARIKNHTVFPYAYDDVFDFTYDSDKKLVRITNNKEYYNYLYSGNQLISVAHYVNGDKHDFTLYDYENGRLTQIDQYEREFGSSVGHLFTGERYFFYYPDGNLKQEVNYSFDAQRNKYKDLTIDYADYDNKSNTLEPISRFQYLSKISLAKNNPRSQTLKDEVNGNTITFSYEYTYNDFSKPVTGKMVRNVSGNVEVEVVRYFYY